MHKGRVEAFSDGVIAVIITVLVLELHPPHSADWSALAPLVPVFVSYVLSFANLGLWWNNHHHMLQAANRIDGRVLWANLFLLFWLSLMPFVTGWMGENNFSSIPVALYGADLFMSGVAYYFLTSALVAVNGHDSPFAKALGRDFKGKASLVLYGSGVIVAFLDPPISMVLYAAVALMWFVPDRRMERVVSD